MRGVWIDAGNDPVWEKIDAHGIRWLYFPLSDPPADVRRRLLTAQSRGYDGGVYAAWNWYGDPTGPEFAQIVSDAIRSLQLDTTNRFPKVMLDDERHDPDTIAALLVRWRQLHRYQDTAWTFESMQGGWMGADFVRSVQDSRVRLVPTCYRGNMVAVDALAAVRDLTRRGFADTAISPFYDAAQLQLDWDGFAFTMGRLP